MVNGLQENVPERSSLRDLIVRFEEGDVHLIVELNGRFIHARNYAATRVSAGDEVEFIHPLFGG